jgi:hypothetical protein
MRRRARHKKTSLKQVIEIEVEVEATVEAWAPLARSRVAGRGAGCGPGWLAGARRPTPAGLGLARLR